jgi:hypothetical protein
MDDLACHARRYGRSELQNKLEGAGFVVVRSTSFVSFLLPVMMLARFLKRNQTADEVDPSSELEINPVLNALFYAVLRLELLCIRAGINFPLGGSRLVVAHRTR